MNKRMYLVAVYSLDAYTVGELERMLNERYGGKAHEVVCDVNEKLVRVFAERSADSD